MRQTRSEQEYLYSASRFRAKAAKLPSSEQLLRMTDAKDTAECVRMLNEAGIIIRKDETGKLLIEQSLDEYLKNCFDEVSSCIPEPDMVNIFRFPYDAHNVKVLLKSRVRGINPFPLLMSMGTLSPEDAELAVREGDYSRFSPEIGAAIPSAIALYAQTSDPQLLDAVVDAGCFADMLREANRYGCAYLTDAVQTKIDTVNILTALRILRMGGYAYSYYSQHFIQGGKLSDEMMKGAFEGGERELIARLAHTPYTLLCDTFSNESEARLSAWEQACDRCYRLVIRQADRQMAGAQVLFAFLADRENEVRNIRILLTSKQAGLPAPRIRELLRGTGN